MMLIVALLQTFETDWICQVIFCYLTALSLQGVAVLFPYGYESNLAGLFFSFDSMHTKVKV